jgi:hypothetical protein
LVKTFGGALKDDDLQEEEAQSSPRKVKGAFKGRVTILGGVPSVAFLEKSMLIFCLKRRA